MSEQIYTLTVMLKAMQATGAPDEEIDALRTAINAMSALDGDLTPFRLTFMRDKGFAVFADSVADVIMEREDEIIMLFKITEELSASGAIISVLRSELVDEEELVSKLGPDEQRLYADSDQRITSSLKLFSDRKDYVNSNLIGLYDA